MYIPALAAGSTHLPLDRVEITFAINRPVNQPCASLFHCHSLLPHLLCENLAAHLPAVHLPAAPAAAAAGPVASPL
jgi:hypothetical protein